MKITVTAADIASGRRGSSCDCPIARAIRRAGGDITADVACSYAYVGRRPHRRQLLLPLSARQFMADFDHGEPVEPFEFELDLP